MVKIEDVEVSIMLTNYRIANEIETYLHK